MPPHLDPEKLQAFRVLAEARKQNFVVSAHNDLKTHGIQKVARQLFGQTDLLSCGYPSYIFVPGPDDRAEKFQTAVKAKPGRLIGRYANPPELVRLDVRNSNESRLYLTIDLGNDRLIVKYLERSFSVTEPAPANPASKDPTPSTLSDRPARHTKPPKAHVVAVARMMPREPSLERPTPSTLGDRSIAAGASRSRERPLQPCGMLPNSGTNPRSTTGHETPKTPSKRTLNDDEIDDYPPSQRTERETYLAQLAKRRERNLRGKDTPSSQTAGAPSSNDNVPQRDSLGPRTNNLTTPAPDEPPMYGMSFTGSVDQENRPPDEALGRRERSQEERHPRDDLRTSPKDLSAPGEQEQSEVQQAPEAATRRGGTTRLTTEKKAVGAQSESLFKGKVRSQEADKNMPDLCEVVDLTGADKLTETADQLCGQSNMSLVKRQDTGPSSSTTKSPRVIGDTVSRAGAPMGGERASSWLLNGHQSRRSLGRASKAQARGRGYIRAIPGRERSEENISPSRQERRTDERNPHPPRGESYRPQLDSARTTEQCDRTNPGKEHPERRVKHSRQER
ncbi:MAG: hypothetical protein Q9169_005857 [Polycauliona sp. 2 TL-2023]